MSEDPDSADWQKFASQPKNWVCPKCGYTALKTPGIPLKSKKCPICDVELKVKPQ